MKDPKNVIGNALLSSIDGLSDSYDTLSALPADERKIYIQDLIETNEEIKKI